MCEIKVRDVCERKKQLVKIEKRDVASSWVLVSSNHSEGISCRAIHLKNVLLVD